MTTTTFDLVHENRPCRVEERRSAKTPRGFAGYMMVKVRLVHSSARRVAWSASARSPAASASPFSPHPTPRTRGDDGKDRMMARTLDETISYIETYLDPAGEIKQEFLADPDAQQDIDNYARAAVAELNDVYADEGGAGVTDLEMANYLWRLAELKANDEAN
jgi:hypothetical protein